MFESVVLKTHFRQFAAELMESQTLTGRNSTTCFDFII